MKMIKVKLMKAAGSFLNHKRSIFVVTLTVVGIVCGMAAKAYDSSRPSRAARSEHSLVESAPRLAPSAVGLQNGGIDENTPVELVVLQPYGFEPAVIHRKPGQFLLVVENHSSVLAGLSLSISNSLAQPLRQTTMPLQRLNWDSVLDLQAGTYTLAAGNNPNWKCSIVIID